MSKSVDVVLKDNKGKFNLLTVMIMLGLTRFSNVLLVGVPYFTIPISISVIGLAMIFYTVTRNEFSSFFKPATIFLLLTAFVIYFLSVLITNETYLDNIKSFMLKCIILIFYWQMYLYLYKCDKKVKRIVLIYYLLNVFISVIYTLYVQNNSGETSLSREYMTGDVEGFSFRVGGFDFIYALLFIHLGMIYYLKYQKEKIKFIFFMFIIFDIFFVILISTSGYATALVLLIVGTLYVLLPSKNRLILIIIIMSVIYFFSSFIGDFIKGLSFLPPLTTSRISDVFYSFSGMENVHDHLTSNGQRVNRMIWSLKIIAENPFFGGYLGKTDLRFGDHTEWLDVIARYGIIASTLYFSFFVNTYTIMKKNESSLKENLELIKISFLLLFVLGFLNPIVVTFTMTTLFVFVPFVYDTFAKDKNIHIE